jgi:hypothetical protein
MDPILRKLTATEGYAYWCPGCKSSHWIPVPRWTFNGSMERPTFSPSVRHYIPAGQHGPERTFCHYFIRDGKIEYCGDCEHELAGKTVDMVPGPSNEEYGWPE